MNRFTSRKFILAAFFALAGTGALYLGKMTGSDYIGLVTFILAAYGASNVAHAHISSKTTTTTTDVGGDGQ